MGVPLSLNKQERSIVYALLRSRQEMLEHPPDSPGVSHPAREKAPLVKGWLLHQDIRKYAKDVPNNKIPFVIKGLEEKEIVERKRAPYKRKGQRGLFAYRLKTDKKTFMRVWHYMLRPRENLYLFLHSEYYLSSVRGLEITSEYLKDFGIPHIPRLPEGIDPETILERFGDHPTVPEEERYIFSTPDYFEIWLEDRDLFKKKVEEFKGLFGNDMHEMARFLYCMSLLEQYMEKPRSDVKGQFKIEYAFFKLAIGREGLERWLSDEDYMSKLLSHLNNEKKINKLLKKYGVVKEDGGDRRKKKKGSGGS